ncbi:MAG TPA: alpha/beta hydrolase [Burkholderiales bacterium]
MPTERLFFTGDAGRIEVLVDQASGAPRGLALIAHPHPQYGGTADNKVVQTLAKTFAELGYIALRPNFRGIGDSLGDYDRGVGETDDLVGVAEQARTRYGELPIVLAGFSFGGYVQTRVAQRVTPERMVLVAPATGSLSGDRDYDTPPVRADTIVIHGEKDETVPLVNVLDWARPQDLPIIVVPEANHFFHRRLHIIKRLVQGAWQS